MAKMDKECKMSLKYEIIFNDNSCEFKENWHEVSIEKNVSIRK